MLVLCLLNCEREAVRLIHVWRGRSQLGKGILITPTVKEIFNGKRELLNAVSPTLVEHFAGLLKVNKEPQYIDFLMSICLCGSESKPEPLSKVQDMVTSVLLEGDTSLLPKFRVEQKQETGITLLVSKPGNADSWMNVADFHRPNFKNPKNHKSEDYSSWIMTTALSDLDDEQKFFRYIVRCTNLYGRLALGRNQKALKLLICNSDLCLDYKTILSVMKEESLPHVIRARYTTLMARLYVDRDPQTQVPSIMRTRVWSKVVPEQSDLNMASDEAQKSGNAIPTCTDGFVDLQEFLLRDIPKVADCKDRHGKSSLNGRPTWGQLQLVQAQLELADMMMDFGFFRGLAKSQRSLARTATATATLTFVPPGTGQETKTQLAPSAALTSGPLVVSYAHIRVLFEGLWSILDSRESGESNDRDVSERQGPSQRKGDKSTESELRNSVRVQALSLLSRIVDIRLNQRVSDAIQCYEQIFEGLLQPDVLRNLSKSKSSASLASLPNASSFNLLMRNSTTSMTELASNVSETSTADQAGALDDEVISSVFSPFQDKVKQLEATLFEKNIVSPPKVSADTYKSGGDSFCDPMVFVMLDLCSFNDNAMTKSCLSILFRNMSQRPAMLNQLKEVQILVFPQAAKVYKEVEYIITRFSACQKFIFKSASREQSARRSEAPSQEEVQQEQDAYKEVSQLLQRMTKYVTVSKDNAREIVLKNQAIMLNLEVDTPVRRLLELNLRRDTSRRDQGELEADTPGSEQLRDLFQDCYTFLKFLTKGNPTVQKRMFPFIAKFAEHVGIEKLNVSDTIAEIVRDNPKLAGRIGEQLFSKFIYAVKIFGRRARWLNFLQPFLIVKNKTPVKRNQDVIVRLLLDEKEAIVDLSCDYRNSEYLSKADTRYGKTRIDLLLDDEHRLPVFSLLNYHVTTLRTLANCCFGKNAENINKVASVVPFPIAVDNILDLNLRDDGMLETNIDPDAIRFVQVGWVTLLADVHFSCSPNDIVITDDIKLSRRIYNGAQGRSLLGEFSTNAADLKHRLVKQDKNLYFGELELFENTSDNMGHNLGTHLELVQQIIRATKLLLQKRDMLLQDAAPTMLNSAEVLKLRTNMVALYPVFIDFGFTLLAKNLAELISVMNEAGIKGDQLASDTETPEKEASQLGKEHAFRDGFHMFQSYLYQILQVDRREGRSMDVPIKDAALLFGSRNTYKNDDYQSLKQFMKLMQSPDVDEMLLRDCLKVLRAILYMRPGELTPEEEEREYVRHLNNEFSSFTREPEHLQFQERMAKIGMADVVVLCCQHENNDTVLASLQLAVALLDGGSDSVQDYFARLLTPASSAPFFAKLHSLFAEAQESFKEAKRNLKEEHAQRIALKKAGIRVPSVKMQDGAKMSDRSQEHMTEVLKMMRRCCLGECELQDVLRVQRLNAISYNFFVEAVTYLEAIEPELKDAIDNGEMQHGTDKWVSPLVDSVMRGFLMLADAMTGPNVENQKVIAETGIFDLCDRIFARIKLEHLDSHEHGSAHNSKDLTPEAKAKIKARNDLRCELKLSITRCLEGFLEGVRDDSIVKQMVSQLNWDGVEEQMRGCYHALKHQKKHYIFSEKSILQEGCSYYRLLRHCEHYDRANEFIQPAIEDVSPKVLHFFQANTGMIEILRNDQLERVYFQLPSACLKDGPLDKPDVDQQLYDTDRDDVEQKARDFIENMCERVNIEQFEESVRETALAFTVTKLWLIRMINFWWTALMHVIMVNLSYMPHVGFWASSFHDDYQERIWIEERNPVALGYPEDAKFSEYCGDWCDNEFYLTARDISFFYDVLPVVDKILRYMSWFNLVTCSLRFFAYCWGELPNVVRLDLEEQRNAALDDLDPEEEVIEHADVVDAEDTSDLVWIEDWNRKKHTPHVQDDGDDGSTIVESDGWAKVKSALSTKGLYYEAGFVIFPLIAVATDEPLFTFYCLFEILFWENSRPVVDAVAINAGKMFQLCVVGVLCIYVWLVVGMLLLHDAHYQDFCSNMFQCFMSYVDISIRAYGVHEVLSFVEESFKYPHNIVDAVGWNEESRTTGVFMIRLLWDASFQILFGYIIIVGIIPGIIIDAFTELKDRKEDAKEDLKQVCFVCSMSRNKVDQDGIGFDKHIKTEHNPRHYLYFLVNLQKKTKNEFTVSLRLSWGCVLSRQFTGKLSLHALLRS